MASTMSSEQQQQQQRRGGGTPPSDGGGGGGGGNGDDDGFLRQLEMAKALSLETLELERIQRQRKTSDAGQQPPSDRSMAAKNGAARTSRTPSASAVVVALPAAPTSSRPRPGTTSRQTSTTSTSGNTSALYTATTGGASSNSSGSSSSSMSLGSGHNLAPPPRRQLSQPATPPVQQPSLDLMSFTSPDTGSKSGDHQLDALLDMAFDDNFGSRAPPPPTTAAPSLLNASTVSPWAAAPLSGPLPLSCWNFPSPIHWPANVFSAAPAPFPTRPPPASNIHLPAAPASFAAGMTPPPPLQLFVGGRCSPANLASQLSQPSPPLGSLPGAANAGTVAATQVQLPVRRVAADDLIDLCFLGVGGGGVNAGSSSFGGAEFDYDDDDVLLSFDPLLKRASVPPPPAPSSAQTGADVTPPPEVVADAGQAPPVPLRGHSSMGLVSSAGGASLTSASPKVQLRRQGRSTVADRRMDRSISYRQRCSRVYESIRVMSDLKGSSAEIQCYRDSLVRLRREFTHDDHHTNPGLLIGATLESLREESSQVRLAVHLPVHLAAAAAAAAEKPVLLTCDVTTSVEHVISQIVCSELEDAGAAVANMNLDNYVLKVHGMEEYLAADSALIDYEYVHHCQKFDQAVRLSLVDADKLSRSLARTARDDERDVNIEVSDLLPPSCPTVSHHTLSILTETLDRQVARLKSEAEQGKAASLQCRGVTQAVKAICATLGQVETKEVRDAVEALGQVESLFAQPRADRMVRPEVETALLADAAKLPVARLVKQLPSTPGARMVVLGVALERINDAIHNLLEMYCRCFFVHFNVPAKEADVLPVKNVIACTDSFLINVGSVHRIPPQWATGFDHFVVCCELYHGSRLLTSRVETRPVQVTTHFYQQLIFDEWLELCEVPLRILPREARLCCTLYGVRALSGGETSGGGGGNRAVTDSGATLNAANSAASDGRESLGWAALQLFDFNGVLCQGSCVCGMWSEEAVDKRLGPAISNTQDLHCPVMQINLPDFGCIILFPPALQDSPGHKYQSLKRDFESLSGKFQQRLIDIVESTSSSNILEDRELVWDRRHFLYDIPQALPKVLMSAHSWDWSCLADLYLMLRQWRPLCAVDAMELLLPCFPDLEVRKTAISWIKNMSSDELCDFLPEMVQALKYETYEDSPTARFLLERSLTSIRVMHHLYWLLKQNLDDVRCGRRILLTLNSLKAIAGHAMRTRLQHQEALMSNLAQVATKIKSTKDSLRQKVLLHELETTSALLEDTPTCLPLNPSAEVRQINFEACHYFTSKTLPLKISFRNRSGEPRVKCIEAIFKDGDDLRQDMLTLQLIRIMDKLWLKDGLDLRIVTFGCIPTDLNKGIVEMVESAETLRSIQSAHGVTGPFKDHLIAEWLKKHNPSEPKYAQAVENFTYSCAGYSVATYVLGICDRHNDNIMIKTSGHIFHIDFGKFLGDCQMFGNIKRDRVPFVLTSDMAFVINGDGKPSSRFQLFVETCCRAFNVVRKNGTLFLNLLAMMSSAGIPGVTTEAVGYVQQALLLHCSDAEASVKFTRLIEESLKAWFTQFNFFIHSLVQLFSGEQNSDGVLSFVPRTHTMETDGKINGVQVVGYQKRYDPEKHYVYILSVEREAGVSSYLFRSYPEFCEFQAKLCARFPLAKYRSLPRVYLGRSNIRQVAEKRRVEIDNFVSSLYKMADEIKHCDLVYTFFHPVLRDQHEDSQLWTRMKVEGPKQQSADSAGCVTGHVKLSIHYKAGILFVMVMHARNLSENKGQAPDPYVKTYLVPDPTKNTKRKTKVVRRNAQPTFMEMLQYQLPLEVVRQRSLQVTVWNSGLVAENAFLGAVEIRLSRLDLTNDTLAWYKLGNLNQLMQK